MSMREEWYNIKRGNFYFGKSGNFYFGLTQYISTVLLEFKSFRAIHRIILLPIVTPILHTALKNKTCQKIIHVNLLVLLTCKWLDNKILYLYQFIYRGIVCLT